MLKIEKGGEYTAKTVRSGTSETGPWEIINVKEEGGARREISIFAANPPSGVVEGGRFKVEEITMIKLRRKKNTDGSWSHEDRPLVEAIMTPIEDALEDDGLGGDDFYGGLL